MLKRLLDKFKIKIKDIADERHEIFSQPFNWSVLIYSNINKLINKLGSETASRILFSSLNNVKQNILCHYLMQRKPHKIKRRFSIY